MRRILAILFTAAPFVAGAMAALSARRDWRMLCMAVAATVVVRVVAAATPRRSGGIALAAFVTATFAAAIVATAFGARAVFGIVAVAVVLAACAEAGVVLARRAPTAAM